MVSAKAVLFDLDNTLIDFMRMKRESCRAAVEAMIGAGLKMDNDAAFNLFFRLYDQYGIEHPTIFQEFSKHVLNRIDYRIISAGIVAYRKIQASYIKPYPGVVPTLLELKKRQLKVGIVSDAPSVNAWIRLTEMKLNDFFDVVVTFDEVGERKPSPLPFKKAIDALKVEPAEIIFVGDWPERDIIGAKAMGMRTVFATYGYHRPAVLVAGQSGADHEISDITQLLGLVGNDKIA